MSYTASQLVTLACQICNIPGRTAQVGQMLNIILSTYAKTMDEDTIRKPLALSIGPTTDIPHFYSLPSDYLRYYDVFYIVNGEPFYLDPVELDDFDKLFVGQGISNYPNKFTTDVGTTPISIAFYPPAGIPLSIQGHYRPQTADITNPESSATVPWFPDQRTLFKDLCCDASMLSDDPQRGSAWENEVERRMRKYLIMSDDKEGFAQTVKLDPNKFRVRGGSPASKKTGF